ncbi:LacI family DNA-binding transcriptional regulator [Vibrio sp. TH_r3]|uniref:LacI family DNA-binding transcriptional regulator n=1 Tax=Vibrio sp. TH_r3 TaxID=3082084 RepID=UPI0029534C2B|nr:LacI family DNA-binding transcriptional regulator [Vibrio sp. TH_r3]MDV7105778.1 LacI family DNA-binding transcriptional regulator [Vibrio sp. TH_r3]
MSTIVDVCKLAGVSKATVSRVVNGTGQVKESTREAVFAAMEQLGYRPNKLAQALATNRTNSIGLVVSDFDGVHFGLLLKQAAASTDSAHKQLIVTNGKNDPEQEYEAIRQLEGRCDAVILYSRTLSDEHIKTLNKQLSIPLVILNRNSSESSYYTVSFDQEGAITLMMEYLIKLGHRDIACITGPLDNPTGQARLAGYKNALKASEIPFQMNLVQTGDYHMMSGYTACKKLLAQGASFSAIVAFNDNMAVGALKALNESRINVPEQVSIIGIDNDPITEFFNPTLTTVELPIEDMTKQAVDLALELIETKQRLSCSHHHYGKLIERNSVIPFQGQKNS